MQQRRPDWQQLDLFSKRPPPPTLPSDLHQRVLPWLGALLREAARQAEEVDHEDHA